MPSEQSGVEIGLSAVVCTRNRGSLLRTSLASLADQDLDPSRFEILIVDNASTDDTSQIARTFASGIENARYVQEPAVGLSAARNRALNIASGRVVAFLDDDAEASTGWASAHLAAYDENPTVVATGGPISLSWEGSQPRWFSQGLNSYFSGLDLGMERLEFHDPSYPYGTNMSVNRAAAEEIGGFDTRLGRRGANLISCEETDFFLRLQEGGKGMVVYLPTASVVHHVGHGRQSVRWLLRRAFVNGVSTALMHERRGTAMRSSRECVRACGRMSLYGAGTLFDTARGGVRRALPRGAGTAYWAGYAAELARSGTRRSGE